MHNFKFRKRIVSLLESGEIFAVAKLILVNGHAPQNPGTSMIIKSNKSIEFTIGGGPFEAEVIEDALSLIHSEKVIVQKKYKLNVKDLGMYCSGEAVVLIEVLKPPPKLFIFGAGHVGGKLAVISSQLDIFNVFLIDDRKEFLDEDLFSQYENLKLIHTDKKWLKGIPEPDKDSFLVVLTRCHGTDKTLIKNYIYKNYAYLGMLGSQTKVKKMWKELHVEGVDEKKLKKVYAPIGLKISAKNPSEISISILGEILKIKTSISS